jgi:hypothetical protein
MRQVLRANWGQALRDLGMANGLAVTAPSRMT